MRKLLCIGLAVVLLAACSKQEAFIERDNTEGINLLSKMEGTYFSEISNIDLGGVTASEITAFDPLTKRLFVVNNDGGSRIDVIDYADPANPVKITSIDVTAYGGFINSVAVSNGKLAGAVENLNKQMPGKVIVFSTTDHSVIKEVVVGALPDMVAFSPDGSYIMTANEGEANNYLPGNVNPDGTISMIEVEKGYAVTTLGFGGFESQKEELMAKGFRIYAPGQVLHRI